MDALETDARTGGEASALVVGMAYGYMAAQALRAAARIAVADLLRDEPLTSAEFALRQGTDPQATHRLCRTLVALGLLAQDGSGRFSLTEAGALLRTDRPDSLHALVCMLTDPTTVGAWQGLEESVRTGEPQFAKEFGQEFFDYLAAQPHLSEQFNTAMSQNTRKIAGLVARHYDFGKHTTVLDIGGGDGTLLAEILRAHPSVKGVLLDLPEALTTAAETFAAADVLTRGSLEQGDFFTAVPPGGDLHVLKSVLHDWNDEQCLTILRRCREALPDDGRLLIVERVLPDRPTEGSDGLMFLSDLNMMVKIGGRERTRADFAALLREAGFRLSAVNPLPPPHQFSLIEAEAVPPGRELPEARSGTEEPDRARSGIRGQYT
ncbi:methyltransferase [Streptomyces lucensis JCM 4490]|uniref:Methyltransferase n=1 Tax=Streptomyces lucensis JCM 4490 TaxID=1306176 RepID=A0A918JFT5_9ACTN|nr:methyltransferase [Streptomyces lucensis]GGW79227.1 methyltransferase [Streptomyces lucensis JCM 4490]